MEELKATFLRAYSNVPLSLRDNTVVILPGNEVGTTVDTPISWNVAFIEVMGDTERSDTILTALHEIDII